MLIGEKYTIATHLGSKIARQHNIRDRRITDKEGHIDPNGKHEIWLSNYTEREAYHMLFDKSVAEYNAKQKRSDRKIEDYYTKIKNGNEKKSSYEMIISIGNYDHRIPEDLSYEILKEFVETWGTKNPNMVIYGCYYHADEQGVPHAHIDFIPIGTNFTRGQRVQVSLSRALEQMGFFSDNKKSTAQIKWIRSENERLEKICNAHGIEVDHPMIQREHLEKEEYILEQKVKNLNADISEKKNEIEKLKTEKSDISTGIENLKSEKKKAKTELDKIAPVIKSVTSDFEEEIKDINLILPEPVKRESAADYRKRIVPIVNKIIKRIMEKARSFHRLLFPIAEENQKLKTENSEIKMQNKTLKEENDSLRKTLSVFNTIRNHFGQERMDEMYDEAEKARQRESKRIRSFER